MDTEIEKTLEEKEGECSELDDTTIDDTTRNIITKEELLNAPGPMQLTEFKKRKRGRPGKNSKKLYTKRNRKLRRLKNRELKLKKLETNMNSALKDLILDTVDSLLDCCVINSDNECDVPQTVPAAIITETDEKTSQVLVEVKIEDNAKTKEPGEKITIQSDEKPSQSEENKHEIKETEEANPTSAEQTPSQSEESAPKKCEIKETEAVNPIKLLKMMLLEQKSSQSKENKATTHNIKETKEAEPDKISKTTLAKQALSQPAENKVNECEIKEREEERPSKISYLLTKQTLKERMKHKVRTIKDLETIMNSTLREILLDTVESSLDCCVNASTVPAAIIEEADERTSPAVAVKIQAIEKTTECSSDNTTIQSDEKPLRSKENKAKKRKIKETEEAPAKISKTTSEEQTPSQSGENKTNKCETKEMDVANPTEISNKTEQKLSHSEENKTSAEEIIETEAAKSTEISKTSAEQTLAQPGENKDGECEIKETERVKRIKPSKQAYTRKRQRLKRREKRRELKLNKLGTHMNSTFEEISFYDTVESSKYCVNVSGDECDARSTVPAVIKEETDEITSPVALEVIIDDNVKTKECSSDKITIQSDEKPSQLEEIAPNKCEIKEMEAVNPTSSQTTLLEQKPSHLNENKTSTSQIEEKEEIKRKRIRTPAKREYQRQIKMRKRMLRRMERKMAKNITQQTDKIQVTDHEKNATNKDTISESKDNTRRNNVQSRNTTNEPSINRFTSDKTYHKQLQQRNEKDAKYTTNQSFISGSKVNSNRNFDKQRERNETDSKYTTNRFISESKVKSNSSFDKKQEKNETDAKHVTNQPFIANQLNFNRNSDKYYVKCSTNQSFFPESNVNFNRNLAKQGQRNETESKHVTNRPFISNYKVNSNRISDKQQERNETDAKRLNNRPFVFEYKVDSNMSFDKQKINDIDTKRLANRPLISESQRTSRWDLKKPPDTNERYKHSLNRNFISESKHSGKTNDTQCSTSNLKVYNFIYENIKTSRGKSKRRKKVYQSNSNPAERNWSCPSTSNEPSGSETTAFSSSSSERVNSFNFVSEACKAKEQELERIQKEYDMLKFI